MFKFFQRNKIHVKKFVSEDGSPRGALLSINGDLSNSLLKQFKENYSLHGSYIQNGGETSAKSILGLMASGGGALGMSYGFSGSLFVATANPASLMVIGNGVGSAVMGSGGLLLKQHLSLLAWQYSQ